MTKLVTVTVNGIPRLARVGTRLSELLSIEQPCGGQGRCGKCKVPVNGKEELACRYVVRSDVSVEVNAPTEILSPTGIREVGMPTGELCLALDVGTTTLAMAPVSRKDGKAVRVITAANPQRIHGADVITRIDFCRKHSVTPLRDLLIAEINRMIERLDTRADTLYVSANVTMLHTLFGEDCSALGVAPYTPAFLESRTEAADALGIRGVKTVISLPSIAPFVGADLVAGLNLIGLPKEGKYHLLVDLGTNAEVVLYSERSGVAASAAAGPCFEGANIRCGMSATAGAICSFSLNYGHTEYHTVGNEPPRGICGTGLIDLIAELLKNGIIDETGYMDGSYEITEGVFLTPEDVRQYQLAKSAVCSSILTLLQVEGIGFEEISALYLSGGFSTAINVRNAAITGLLPRELAHKAVALSNSSLRGTVKYACEGGDLAHFVTTTRSVDLSSDPCFADLFLQNMRFEEK